MIGMATVKKTLSLDEDAWAFAERAAKRCNMSPSAWLSRQARQQAIMAAYPGGPQGTEDDALADEIEYGLASAEG